MALTVATNTGALMAQAAAISVNKDMETSMHRLSTGMRINSAADDAAGVAIASRLTAEVKGTNMAIRNAMDAQALIDTAEGAHVEIGSILQRMRELAVQAANDTNSAADRDSIDSTVSNLTNISSNLQAGRGRIEDADFAAETTSLAKSQILQQASTAMLAQANASKQNVLSLLQG